MTSWFHSIILATCLAATVAVGIASAAVYSDLGAPAAKKSDRLMTTAIDTRSPEITVERRGEGVSILTRIPAPAKNRDL